MSNYEKGFYPVSIGISLALERLNGVGEFAKEKPLTTKETGYYKECKYLLINLRSIYRSIFSSWNVIVSDPSAKELAEAVEKEVDVIRILFKTQMDTDVRPLFYHMSYNDLPSVLPFARLRALRTDLQEKRKLLEDNTYGLLTQDFIDKIEKWDCGVKGDFPTCLMLTHMPVDLLSRKRFTELYLLESNTGRIKARDEWASKLIKKPEDQAFIPFNKMTLTVFGDFNKLITSYTPSAKKTLLAMATSNNWSPYSTKDRIKDTLDRERDAPFAMQLKRML